MRGIQVSEWMEKALCAQVDPDLFHPDKANPTSRKAKEVCFRCEVRSECLSWALENPAVGGILGGTTEKERFQIKRRLREQQSA